MAKKIILQKWPHQLEEAELLRIITEGREEHRQGRTRKIKALRELRWWNPMKAICDQS